MRWWTTTSFSARELYGKSVETLLPPSPSRSRPLLASSSAVPLLPDGVG